MRNPRPLIIPYLPQLGDAQPADFASILDAYGERRTIESLNWPKGYPYHPLTTFTIAHDGKMIYIDFFVRCNFLRAVNFEDNSPVSQDSCVEFFVSPKCDNRYWNFEFNCIGTVNASTRTERANPQRLTHQEIERIFRDPSCGTRPFEELEGLFAWSLLVGIPLDMIGVEFKGEPIHMKGNFYKCASACTQPHYLSWYPIDTEKPDFHRPEFFGDITLGAVPEM